MSSTLKTIAMPAIFITYLLWLLAGNVGMEWYSIPDMDRAVTIEQIRLNSTITPYWLHHTGFTMDLVLHLIVTARALLTGVPAADFATLDQAMSPMFVVADLTTFIRAVSPFAALTGALLTWEAVRRGLRLSTTWAVAALAVALSSDWIVYHSAMIRSELYSIAPWGAALMLGVLALDARSSRKALGLWFTAGLCLALAYLSKVQAVILVGSSFIFWAGLVRLRATEGVSQLIALAEDGRATKGRAMAAICLVALLGIFALALRFPMPDSFVGAYFEGAPAHYGFSRQMQAFTLALVGGIFVLSRGQNWKHGPLLQGTAMAIVVLLAGFLAAFLTHFLCYSSLSAGWHYLLADFKVGMMRMEGLKITHFGEAMGNFRNIVLNTPVLHAVYLASVVAAISLAFSRRDRVAATLVALLAVLFVFQTLFVIRPMPRDTMYTELLFLVAGAFNLTIIALGRPRLGGVLATLAVALVLGEALPTSANTHDYLKLNYARYGWDLSTWLDEYPGFKAVTPNAYGNDESIVYASVQHGEQAQRIEATAHFILPSHNISSADIGLLMVGAPSARSEFRPHISKIPQGWEGATLIDTARLSATSRPLIAPQGIAVHEDILANLRPWVSPAEETVELIPRFDLRVALAVPPAIAQLLSDINMSESGETIQSKQADGSMEILSVLPVNKAILIPRAILGSRAVVLFMTL